MPLGRISALRRSELLEVELRALFDLLLVLLLLSEPGQLRLLPCRKDLLLLVVQVRVRFGLQPHRLELGVGMRQLLLVLSLEGLLELHLLPRNSIQDRITSWNIICCSFCCSARSSSFMPAGMNLGF